jgi:peroxiredoxin
MLPLKEGERAPDFSLPNAPNRRVALHELRGRPVVLIFYPADWSPDCGDQLALYNELLPEFGAVGAQLIGISCDGLWCHQAFAEDRKLRIPLLSDFEPKGAVSRVYGVYDDKAGEARRALFLIDAKGVVRWSEVATAQTAPGAEGILRALETLARREPIASAGR